MTVLPIPFVELTIAGKASGLKLDKEIKEFTYRDVHHGEVDEIGFRLIDVNGLYRSDWVIDTGTEITARAGYDSIGRQIECGLYAVDEDQAHISGSGDTMTFHAMAAFTSKDLRTKRSEAYEQMTLKNIVGKVADRHDLEHVGDVPDLSFKRITQKKEGDLTFLTRLADDYGCYFSVKGNQLVFIDRQVLEAAPAVRLFDLVKDHKIIDASLRSSSAKFYKKAEVKYLDPKSKKLLSVEREDPRVQSGDTLKIDERAETQSHAEQLCYARLSKENDELRGGDLKVVGDPFLVAGQIVELGPTFGKYTGRWLIRAAKHKWRNSGYTTSLKIKGLVDA